MESSTPRPNRPFPNRQCLSKTPRQPNLWILGTLRATFDDLQGPALFWRFGKNWRTGKTLLVGGYSGKWSNLTHIFQRGWNHQLGKTLGFRNDFKQKKSLLMLEFLHVFFVVWCLSLFLIALPKKRKNNLHHVQRIWLTVPTKGRLMQGLRKAIHGNCAIYWATLVSAGEPNFDRTRPKELASWCFFSCFFVQSDFHNKSNRWNCETCYLLFLTGETLLFCLSKYFFNMHEHKLWYSCLYWFAVGLDGGWEICDLFGEILFENKMAKLSRTQCFNSGWNI